MQPATAPTRSSDVVRSFLERAWNDGSLEAARELLDPSWVDHDPLAFPGREPGPGGLLQVVAMIRSALPDLEREIELQVADGDLVATRFVDRGTHQGDLMGIPASGRSVAVRGMNIDRVRDGRIVETWHLEDLAGLMAQLGAAPG